jgi:hypothetical protein
MKNTPIKSKPTWELRVMIRALSMMPSLNTEAENERLEEAKEELRRRTHENNN